MRIYFLLQDRGKLPAALTSAISSHDQFDQWLSNCEKQVGDDVTSFEVLDLQAIMDRRTLLEV